MRIAISPDGKTIASTKIIPTEKDFEKGIQSIKKTAEELSYGEKMKAIAGGVAGPFDKDKTMLLASPHISDWINKPLKKELERVCGCPVFLENDTALGGLGEANLGTGKDHKIVGYIATGTGVGGVRIVNGKIDENSLGFEPGHQVILINGAPCNCGGHGHLETLIGGHYLEKMYKKKAETINDPYVWNEVARYLSIGLTNTVVHWSPDIVVLGGAVTESIPLEKVENYLKEFLTIYPTPPRIVKSAFKQQSGLYGGLELIKQNLNF